VGRKGTGTRLLLRRCSLELQGDSPLHSRIKGMINLSPVREPKMELRTSSRLGIDEDSARQLSTVSQLRTARHTNPSAVNTGENRAEDPAEVHCFYTGGAVQPTAARK